jgi:hypothetical protein
MQNEIYETGILKIKNFLNAFLNGTETMMKHFFSLESVVFSS